MIAAETRAGLRIAGLTMHFGGLTALSEIDMELEGRGIFGLIGPNGSGKTTLFNLIAGFYQPSAGSIHYSGRDITNWPAERVAGAGIARTFQNLKIFRRLTVADNVAGAQTSLGDVHLWQRILPNRGERARRTRVKDLLGLVGLSERRNDLAGELALGDQRRLELARALAREPDLLLLDEPAGGMTPQETERMAQLIEYVAEQGPTVLLVEHKMSLVMGLCHHITVLNFGRKIAEGAPHDIQSDRAVREAYLGMGGAGA